MLSPGDERNSDLSSHGIDPFLLTYKEVEYVYGRINILIVYLIAELTLHIRCYHGIDREQTCKKKDELMSAIFDIR